MESVLTQDRIESALQSLVGWTQNGNQIEKTFVARSFALAVGFITTIGIMAEAADHHPDLDLRYDKVKVALSTHSAGGLTEKDFALARAIESSFSLHKK